MTARVAPVAGAVSRASGDRQRYPVQVNVAAIAPVRKLTRQEYDRLIQLGWFENERVELIDGILVATSPQGTRHAEAIGRLTRVLVSLVGTRALVRIQLPLALGDLSEPEPDVAIVENGDYSAEHPTAALLVIEVAQSSLRTDRDIKMQLYAAAGIPECWLVDVAARAVDVYRGPAPGGYSSLVRITEDGALRPLHFPDLSLAVREILPTAGR